MERSCRENPCAPARWSVLSGRMANPAQNTGCERNTSNLDATVVSTIEDPEGLPHSGGSSSSKQTAASRVPSMSGPSSFWKQMASHVSGRTGLQETGAVSDRESAATTFFNSQSKG